MNKQTKPTIDQVSKVAFQECFAVNQANPMAVAENIQKAFKALEIAKKLLDRPYSDAWYYLVNPGSPRNEDQTSLGDIIDAVLSAIEKK